jgi:hypothetical protein
MIRPEFLNDPEFCRLSTGARFLFFALLPHMDRNGVFWGTPQIVRSIVFPCDAKMRWADVQRWLDELHQIGRVRLFTYNGVVYLMDPQFGTHQNIYTQDPDTYRIPVEIRSKVIQDWIEEQRQLNLDLLNLNPNLNLNQNTDKKNQASGGGLGAPLIPTTSNEVDAKIAELNQKLILDKRRELGLHEEDGSPRIPGYGPALGGDE